MCWKVSGFAFIPTKSLLRLLSSRPAIPVSNCQRQQLAFISEFATDIAHVPGLENVVANALTRQYDDEGAAAIVHSVAHSLSDINLSELSRDQPPIDDESVTSLKLQHVQFLGVGHTHGVRHVDREAPDTGPRCTA